MNRFARIHPVRPARSAPAVPALALAVVLGGLSGCRTVPPAGRESALKQAAARAREAPPPAPPGVAGHVLLVDDVEGLGLFGDEVAEADALVASWARSRGWKVVDPNRARQVFARARAGRDARSGAACGRPLAQWQAASRWQSLLGADGKIVVDVSCEGKADGPCALHLSAFDSLGFDGSVLADLTAPYPRDRPFGAALPGALRALQPIADQGGGEGGIDLGSLATGKVVARPERLSFSARPATDFDARRAAIEHALSFPDGVASLRACFTGAVDAEVLVAVDHAGRVARCESSEGDDEASVCACRAFQDHARGAPAIRGMRAFVGIHLQTADVVTPRNAVVTASVRTYVEQYDNAQGERRWRPAVTDPAISDWQPPADHLVASASTT